MQYRSARTTRNHRIHQACHGGGRNHSNMHHLRQQTSCQHPVVQKWQGSPRWAVWISRSILSFVTTCTLLETSLQSSHWAAAFLCVPIHASFHCPGVFWCHGSPGSQPALLLLLKTVQMLLHLGIAVHILLVCQGVDVHECLYWFNCISTRSPAKLCIFTVSETEVIMYAAGWWCYQLAQGQQQKERPHITITT